MSVICLSLLYTIIGYVGLGKNMKEVFASIGHISVPFIRYV